MYIIFICNISIFSVSLKLVLSNIGSANLLIHIMQVIFG